MNDIEILTGKSRFEVESKPGIMTHERVVLSFKARAAIAFVERWGMVTAEDGGEDSAGRSKLRASTPEEVVSRSCEMADLLFKSFEERDWLIEVPSMAELEEKYADKTD